MPATADEKYADANIFASARNTVLICRRLQRIGNQSYYRQHRQLETQRLASVSVVHGHGYIRTRTHVHAAMCWCREHICVCSRTHSRKRSRQHISAALPVRAIASYCSLWWMAGGKGRAAGCHAGAQNVKWANAAVETWRVRTVSIKQQLWKPTTEQVLLADCHVELQSLLSLPGNWQADQFMCILRSPTLR